MRVVLSILIPVFKAANGFRCATGDDASVAGLPAARKAAVTTCAGAADLVACVVATTVSSDCTECGLEQFTAESQTCVAACAEDAASLTLECASCRITDSVKFLSECADPALVNTVYSVDLSDKEKLVDALLAEMLEVSPAAPTTTPGCSFPRAQLVTLFADLAGCATKGVAEIHDCMTIRGYDVDAECASCLYSVEKTTCPCTVPFANQCIACMADKARKTARRCVPQWDSRFQGTGRALKCSLADTAALVQGVDVQSLTACLPDGGGENCLPAGLSASCMACTTAVFGKGNFECKDSCETEAECKKCNERIVKAVLGRCTGFVDEVHDRTCSATDKATFDAAGGVPALVNCKKAQNPRVCLATSGIKKISGDCRSCIADSAGWGKSRTCTIGCEIEEDTLEVTCKPDGDHCKPATVENVDVTYCFDPAGVVDVVNEPSDPSACTLSDVGAVNAAITPAAISDCFNQTDAQEIYDCLKVKITATECVQCVDAVLAATTLCSPVCTVSSTSADCESCLTAEIASAAGACILTGTPVYAKALAAGDPLLSSSVQSFAVIGAAMLALATM